IYLHEDLQNDMLSVVRRIFEIIGVDPSFTPDMSRKLNVGYVPKNATREKAFYQVRYLTRISQRYTPWRLQRPIERTLKALGRLVQPVHLARPAMPEDVRASLLEEYREDILKLQDLLRRDLSHWLSSVTLDG